MQHIKLIDFIENVQRRFTKRLHNKLCNDNFCDRLKSCNLELLELRLVHLDYMGYVMIITVTD